MSHADDGLPHGTVVTNLLDLQARLRGDPASLRQPWVGSPLGEPEEPQEGGASGIEAMRRRLVALELEIDAYERLMYAWPPVPTPGSEGGARVIDLTSRRALDPPR
jgi:hypothetical protein